MENPQNGQLILVNRKDTTRLLEVYVKRSLSLNDGKALGERQGKNKPRSKWVTLPERHKKLRRHSSDPLFDVLSGFNDGGVGVFTAVETPNPPEAASADSEKRSKKTKKKKKQKSSFWKNFLGLFSRKGSEEKEEEQESHTETADVSPPEDESDTPAACLPNTGNNDTSKRRKSLRKRFSKRKLSLRKPSKQNLLKENVAGITGVESVVSVEPTYAYYEKVSEELEKIVHEVKEKEEQLADEEVIARIIALTKQQGDAIDEKLKGNSTLCNFFQRISYNSFQELLDAYLQMTHTETIQATAPPTAPELVKLAFTLDFTARVAGLSRQNIGHITGLGTRYLENKFAYQQACTDHPWSDNDDLP